MNSWDLKFIKFSINLLSDKWKECIENLDFSVELKHKEMKFLH